MFSGQKEKENIRKSLLKIFFLRILYLTYLRARANSVFSITEEYATSNGVLPLKDGRESKILLFSNKKAK